MRDARQAIVIDMKVTIIIVLVSQMVDYLSSTIYCPRSPELDKSFCEQFLNSLSRATNLWPVKRLFKRTNFRKVREKVCHRSPVRVDFTTNLDGLCSRTQPVGFCIDGRSVPISPTTPGSVSLGKRRKLHQMAIRVGWQRSLRRRPEWPPASSPSPACARTSRPRSSATASLRRP